MPIKPKNTFTAEVKKQLDLLGMTQKQLAEAIGYGYSNVRSFISGSTYNEDMAQAIARFLKIERCAFCPHLIFIKSVT